MYSPPRYDGHVVTQVAQRPAERGWESVEAYRSRWGDRRAELIVELLGRLKPH